MDELKVFGIPVFTKEYLSTKSGRDGYIEKPFGKLSDKLISQYSEESRIEAEKIHPILESSPHLFEGNNELSMWSSIYNDLSSLGISNDLSKMYDYEGGLLTLRFYLEARGGVEDNALMVTVAYALNVALAKTYCLFHKDIDGLARVVDFAYFSGKTTSLAAFQSEVVAGESRTTDATEAKVELSKERKEKIKVEAKKLRKQYPQIPKDTIAELIFEKVGLAERTVRDDLKKINLSD